ncbi:alpha/beta fold hydrolase [Candidatus Halobonum tyrrellensis]|uniref:Alpha/beta hydrolase fold containing protein n=1 Tax=Candidatus Halobonum tyrrellensis G22 TaxID=1324957 RepID=V4J0T6_9EURY|nr:alpha/beta hydrolase [Candidatus Halobonum tyrrellensis]ESP89082.1 alpha/beta hydrolase fold containing protein [Candidatus Halobonum tyrrellensis G22]
MQRVDHHGRETAYRVSDRGGGGPGLLCVHGSGGAAGVWKAQSRLADRTPVAALDLSGHGASDDVEAAAGPEALEAYADDLVAVARETGARVLVGNSLGGAVALWVALERDLPLSGLVLAGTGARLAVLDDLLGWLADDFDRAVEFLHAPDRLFHDPDGPYADASAAAMRETGRAVTERDFQTCHSFDVRDRLGEVDVPAVAVVGAHDQLTPRHYHDYFADEMPDCEVRVVDDAAHLTMLERPDAFNAAVESLLDRL